jgi:hypothetical protein
VAQAASGGVIVMPRRYGPPIAVANRAQPARTSQVLTEAASAAAEPAAPCGAAMRDRRVQCKAAERRTHIPVRSDTSMSIKRRTAISVLMCAAIAAIAGMALTFSAFTSTTENPGNKFVSGDVVLTSNAAGSKLFDVAGIQPGADASSKCLTVEYTGSLPALVRLYAATTSTPGKDLSPFLDIKVTRGAFSGATPADQACDGFVADTDDLAGKGPGVVFDGLLSAYPADYDAGAQDPTTWATADKAVYRIDASMKADVGDDAQAKDATTKLTFEARDKLPS